LTYLSDTTSNSAFFFITVMSLHSKLLNITDNTDDDDDTSLKTRKVGNWTMKMILTACINAES